MARRLVVLIPSDARAEIFDALDLLNTIDRSQLTTEVASSAPAKAAYAAGGMSYSYKHRRPVDGLHVATTHVLVTPSGQVVHRHGKDILMGMIRFAAERESR